MITKKNAKKYTDVELALGKLDNEGKELLCSMYREGYPYGKLLKLVIKDVKYHVSRNKRYGKGKSWYQGVDMNEEIVRSVMTMMEFLETDPIAIGGEISTIPLNNIGMSLLQIVYDTLEWKEEEIKVVLSGRCSIKDMGYVVLRNKLYTDVCKHFKVIPNEKEYIFHGLPISLRKSNLKANKKSVKKEIKK